MIQPVHILSGVLTRFVWLMIFLLIALRGSVSWGAEPGECRQDGTGSDHSLLKRFVHTEVFSSLKKRWKKQSADVTASIMRESRRFCMDPLLLLSVIQTESRFNPLARGRHGEIGLMQIKPATARWIAGLYGFRWRGKNSLKNPVTNIRLGSAYLAHLQKSLQAPKHLVLTAYNAGPARAREIWTSGVASNQPMSYSGRVLSHYDGLVARYSQVMVTADAT